MKISKHRVAMFCCLAVLAGVVRAGELKMGVPFPKDSKEWKAVAQAATRIATATNNKVVFDLSPPDKKEGLAKTMLNGGLDGGLMIAKDLVDLKLGPDALAYAIPFTFKSSNQVDYVRQHIDTEILRKLSNNRYEAMAIVGFSFAYVMSSGALSTPADWRNRKIWVPDEGELFKSLDGLGLKTTHLPYKDVLKGLRNGTVDTVIFPPSGAILKRWHTRIKRVFDMPFVYMYGIWVVRDDVVKLLSPNEHKIVRNHLTLLCQDLRTAIRERNKTARKVLLRYEIEFVTPDAEMQKQWERWANKVWQDLEEKNRPTKDIEDRLKRYLKAFESEQN